MKIRDAIQWFQTTFAKQLASALNGTPFSSNLVTAIAYRETGYIWQPLLEKGLDKNEVLRLCVGDTLDADRGRSAFPKSKAQLLAAPQGDTMFAIARRALVDMAKHIPGYATVVRNPDKFCHGFGIFQYDFQFYREDPEFFIKEQWADISECFKRLLIELNAAKKRVGFGSKPTLTDGEQIITAIAYNKGSYDPAKGLKQGFKNDEGKFYGELVAAFYDLAKSIPAAPGTADGGGPGLNLVHEVPFVPLSTGKAAPKYPGHLIKRDSADTTATKLIQQRLRDLGYTEPGPGGGTIPLSVDGGFGDNTDSAVRLFQARHTDMFGAPLFMDGQVGSSTWGALFGAATMPAAPVGSGTSLLDAVLDTASLEVGVLEDPPGSNAGKRVREYQRTVGISAGDAWCAAFVFWCFEQAAAAKGATNPMAKDCRTGGVMDLWNRAREAKGAKTVTTEQALDDPSKVMPGMVFIISTGGGHGHTGFVSRVVGIQLETIEGNTNDGGSREGIGVFRRTGRTIASINRGFIDFGG